MRLAEPVGVKPLEINRRGRPAARQQARNDLFFEHAPQFARHAWRKEEPGLADVECEAAGGTDRVVEDLGGRGQHRLFLVILRHDSVAAAEEILHALQPILVEDELYPGGARSDFLRQIIDRGSEPAIDDHRIGARGRQPKCREQFLAVVTDGRSPAHRQPEILELLGHIAEVRVDDLAGQHLVAGADDLDAHALLVCITGRTVPTLAPSLRGPRTATWQGGAPGNAAISTRVGALSMRLLRCARNDERFYTRPTQRRA